MASSRKALVAGLAIGASVLTISSVLAPDQAHAARSAALVVDANTGKVLYSRQADQRRYPASLTKMMTLFIIFDELEAKRLTLGTRMRVSARAAGVQPSKLGLVVGRSITVRNAIKALITKSANDVAITVAEHIAGSEPAFARRMTARARQLGMSRTTFKNASGLPHRGQITTAYDMVRLGLQLMDQHGKYYGYFKTRSFTYRGRTYRNHNALLRSFPGTDGLKTGYTRASGFNLVTSTRRGRKHLIGAVFGGRSGRARNRTMRRLLTRYFARAATRRTRPSFKSGQFIAAATKLHGQPIRRVQRIRRPVIAARAPQRPRVRQPQNLRRPLPRAFPNAPRQPAFGLRTTKVRTLAVRPQPIRQQPPRSANAGAGSGAVFGDTIAALLARKKARSPLQPARAQAPAPRTPDARPVARTKADLLPRPRYQRPSATAINRLAMARPHARAGLMQPFAQPTVQPPAPTGTVIAAAPPTAQPAAPKGYAELRPTAPPTLRPTGRAPSTFQQQVAQLRTRRPAPFAKPTYRLRGPQLPQPTAAPPPPSLRADGSHHIQVGAYATALEAQTRLAQVRALTPDLISQHQPLTQEVPGRASPLYRARFAGFDARSARSTCAALKARRVECFVSAAR
ncbi:MAG: serine hydrolase [Pseudomonadota bacterium]